jgi:hypothetical protein
MCALGAAVVRVRVLDELGAGVAERDGPGVGVAVGVARVVDDVAERDAIGGHAQQHGCELPDRVVVAAGQGDAAGQFGDGGTVFAGDHDGG